jgi:hypothetical protein
MSYDITLMSLSYVWNCDPGTHMRCIRFSSEKRVWHPFNCYPDSFPFVHRSVPAPTSRVADLSPPPSLSQWRTHETTQSFDYSTVQLLHCNILSTHSGRRAETPRGHLLHQQVVRITVRGARIGSTTWELDQKNRDWEGRTGEFEKERQRFVSSVFVHSKVVLNLFLRLPISARRARTQLTHATHAQLLHGLKPNQIHERASWACTLWFLGVAHKFH